MLTIRKMLHRAAHAMLDAEFYRVSDDLGWGIRVNSALCFPKIETREVLDIRAGRVRILVPLTDHAPFEPLEVLRREARDVVADVLEKAATRGSYATPS